MIIFLRNDFRNFLYLSHYIRGSSCERFYLETITPLYQYMGCPLRGFQYLNYMCYHSYRIEILWSGFFLIATLTDYPNQARMTGIINQLKSTIPSNSDRGECSREKYHILNRKNGKLLWERIFFLLALLLVFRNILSHF